MLRSGEIRDTTESWNRSRRSSENHRLRTISMNSPSTLDVDYEVKVLQEIHPQQGNGNRSKLEVPRIYLGIGTAGET